MFDLFAMIRPVKMRWILTGVAAGFLLTVTPASAQDYETTQHAAEGGDAEAQYTLGLVYATGRGAPQDGAEAVRWFRLAAEQGHALAQAAIEVMATERGDASAQYTLGLMYANGESIPQDDADARSVVPPGRRAGPRRRPERARVHVRHRSGRAAGRC